jgi:hypothetical protein
MYENHPDDLLPLYHHSEAVNPAEQEAKNNRHARRFRQVLETRGDSGLPDAGFPGWRSKPHLTAEWEKWKSSRQP